MVHDEDGFPRQDDDAEATERFSPRRRAGEGTPVLRPGAPRRGDVPGAGGTPRAGVRRAPDGLAGLGDQTEALRNPVARGRDAGYHGADALPPDDDTELVAQPGDEALYDDYDEYDDEEYEDEEDDAAATGKRKHPVRNALLIGLAMILAIAMGVAGCVGYKGLAAIESIERKEGLMPTGSRPAKEVEGPMTMLLAGSDTRDFSNTQGSNSDTMMLVHLPKDRKHVYIISLPRDLWVPIPGYEWAKINAAYHHGGTPLTVQTLERLLGVRIDHVGMMNFEGFIKLTDAVGGVTVNNKLESRQDNYYWPKGEITLQGDNALAYVRQRKGLEGGDLARAERQRAVVKAIVAKAVSAGVLTNPEKLTSFMEQAAKTVALDDSFSDGEVRDTILGMKITSGSDVRTMQVPVAGIGWSYTASGAKDQSIVIADRDQINELAVALRSDSMDKYYATHAKDPQMTGRLPVERQPQGSVPESGLGLEALPAAAGSTLTPASAASGVGGAPNAGAPAAPRRRA